MSAKSLSAVEFLEELRGGKNPATAQLFQEYTRRLVGLARRRLDAATLQKVDPEDVVQSVFRSFVRMSETADLKLANPDHLWNLLCTITARKCSHRMRFFRAAVRDVRREVPPTPGDDDTPGKCDAADPEPTPKEALVLLETVEQMMRGLDARDCEVVTLSLRGYSSTEIAEQVGRSRRSVQLLLQQVRRRLQRWMSED